ncbi:MAG: hypothetical protein ACREBW_09520 [Candidatus Micrarchaeaceae archaeon]
MVYTYTNQSCPKGVTASIHNSLIASGLRLVSRETFRDGSADIYSYFGAEDAITLQGNHLNVFCHGIHVKQLNRLFDDLSQPIDIRALGMAFATENTFMYAKSRRRLAALLSL